MALVCSISQEVPEHPVLSPVSNHVFERRLIVKYIQEAESDPINGEPLQEDQLIDIKTSPLVKPRPPSATSIPAILKLLQDEWDACMLHTFTLRQQLQTARQELSHALYQHDAACRVIARLTKEVNSARESLATLKPQTAVPLNPMGDLRQQQMEVGESMDTAEEGVNMEMSEEILQKLQDTAATLTADRKRRGKKPPEGLATSEAIGSYQQIASHPGLHSASTPGILTLDVCIADANKIVTGGADKNVVVFNKDTEQILTTLKGHSKRINAVVYHNTADIVFSCSPDATIRVWDVANEACGQIIKAHESSVTGISLHPTGDYLLSSSLDQYWAFIDIGSGRVLTKATDQENPAALTCTQFHPDGLIFGTGTDNSVIKIWDLKERSNVANFQGHVGPITSIAFSENGYYLATAARDSQVKLWDLRKLRNFKTLTLGDQYEVKNVSFDLSGNYLAVAGTNVQVYLSKQWDLLKTFTDHTAVVHGVKFGTNASFVTSCGLDRTLRIYSN